MLAEVCRHRPSVVSPAHRLDSLDVEVVSTILVRAPQRALLTITKLAHPQASPALLVASPLVSLGPQVVSSPLAFPVLLAANLPLASTLLPDDNHDNTPENNMPTAAGFTGLKFGEISRAFQRSSKIESQDSAVLCTIA